MGIAYEKGISHSDESAPLFSTGSKREPVANFVNNVAYGTVMAQATISAVALASQGVPQSELSREQLFALATSPEAIANGVAIGIPIGVTIAAFFLLYEKYKRKPDEEKVQTRRRVAEVSRNPLAIFRGKDRPTSAS